MLLGEGETGTLSSKLKTMDTSFFDVFRKRVKIRILEIFMCSDPLVDDCLRYIWIRLRTHVMVIDTFQLDANDWFLHHAFSYKQVPRFLQLQRQYHRYDNHLCAAQIMS
ncbi:hypothetical protein BpHYR1_013279 [Brachionus plicatilis]|uniref:Uncharacterized protein n=1 Tax=Brachionus plicatilis TaxID=10195 RepID=A0A3M7SQS0_BRAPC|nr:hypothetical protein BpHYR1_013279 [Brachionus plicatilis]